jgi:His-Xaa-Ser system protein HxsD
MSTVELRFDASAYSADALQRALYKLADRASGEVTRVDDQYIVVLRMSASEPDAADEIAAGFSLEALDAVLRERIRKETALERNAILSLAFSETGLIADPDE